MKKLHKFLHLHLFNHAEAIKSTFIKIVVTLLTLAAAVTPWVLLIARVTISGVE